MGTETESGYFGMSTAWFYRTLIAGLILGGILSAAVRQWWVMPIVVVVAVAVSSGWAAMQRRHERA